MRIVTTDPDPVVYVYKLTYEWSDDAAEFRYVMRRFSLLDGVLIAEGSRAWAERQAAHYGIEIDDPNESHRSQIQQAAQRLRDEPSRG